MGISITGSALAADAAFKAGFRGAALITAVAIAGAESTFNPNALGDVALQNSEWGPSLGLWQIRSLNPAFLHLEPIRDADKLYDPYFNAKAAFQISKKGTDFSPWSTFMNDAYQNYVQIAANVSDSVEALKKKVT